MPESTSSTDHNDLQLHHALICMATCIFKNRNGIQPESLNLVIHLAVMEVQLLLWPCLWNPWTSQLERNQKPWTQAMQKLEEESPLTELWCVFVPWIVPDFRSWSSGEIWCPRASLIAASRMRSRCISYVFFQQRRVLDGGIFDDSLMHGVSVMPLSPEIASFAAHCGLRK